MERNQFVSVVHFNQSYSLLSLLTRENHARTSILVNARCSGTSELLFEASENRYFNKTYQWFFWGVDIEVETLFPYKLKYVGPNAQITYVNKTDNGYAYWDIHSKGRHLKSRLEINLIATLTNDTLNIACDIFHLQSIDFRGQFNGITLRGASVVSRMKSCRSLLLFTFHFRSIKRISFQMNKLNLFCRDPQRMLEWQLL